MINEQEFIDLCNNTDLSLRIIRRRFGLKYNDFLKLRNRLIEEGKIQPRTFRRKKNTPHKVLNYSYCNTTKTYQIRKKSKYYGCFKNEKQARRFVELLRENDWDYNLKDELKEQVLMEVKV